MTSYVVCIKSGFGQKVMFCGGEAERLCTICAPHIISTCLSVDARNTWSENFCCTRLEHLNHSYTIKYFKWTDAHIMWELSGTKISISCQMIARLLS